MEDVKALIDVIIKEHEIIWQKAQTLEKVTNDIEATAGLQKAKEAFMPGRFNQKQGLQKLQEMLEAIDKGLQAHFNREEKGLLAAFESYGDSKLVAALRSLLLEHKNLKQRFEHAQKHVTELTSGQLARHMWEAKAHDMRAHINHTLKLLEAHARNEQELLMTLRKHLS